MIYYAVSKVRFWDNIRLATEYCDIPQFDLVRPPDDSVGFVAVFDSHEKALKAANGNETLVVTLTTKEVSDE